MFNQADLSVYGCIETAQWDVYSGDELIDSVNAWSPMLAFPNAGDFRVVLSLAGPGGEATHEMTIQAQADTGGCSAIGAGASLVGLFAGLFGVALRRRRDD